MFGLEDWGYEREMKERGSEPGRDKGLEGKGKEIKTAVGREEDKKAHMLLPAGRMHQFPFQE